MYSQRVPKMFGEEKAETRRPISFQWEGNSASVEMFAYAFC